MVLGSGILSSDDRTLTGVSAGLSEIAFARSDKAVLTDRYRRISPGQGGSLSVRKDIPAGSAAF